MTRPVRNSGEVVKDVRRQLDKLPSEVGELLEWYEWLARNYERVCGVERQYAELLASGKK